MFIVNMMSLGFLVLFGKVDGHSIVLSTFTCPGLNI